MGMATRRHYPLESHGTVNHLPSFLPGGKVPKLDKTARDIIKNAGYGEFFGHSLGHGVGIEVHETPNLAPKSKAELKPGNIVTIEPGIYIPDEFGVRIEDFVVITETGYENLTSSPKELIILN